MTTGLIKRIGHGWATLLVVYALVLTSVAPVLAAATPGPTGLVLCTLAGPDDGSVPSGDLDHRRACCVLCQVPALPEQPYADRVPLPPAAEAVALAPSVGDETGASRPPPGTTPQSPRAPPSQR